MRMISNFGRRTGSSSPSLVLRGFNRVVGAIALALLLGTCPVPAEEAEEVYLAIFALIQEADFQATRGEAAPAKAKYQEAFKSLRSLQLAYPNWSTKMVAYRMNYLAAKLAPPAEDAASPAGAAATPIARPAEVAASGATLLEAGAEPRKVLRLHPQAGDKQTVNMTVTLGMAMKMGEMENPPIKLPPMQMNMEVTIKAVSPNGDITFDMGIAEATLAEEPDANPTVAESMKSAVDKLKGLSGSGQITSRGLSKSIDLKAGSDADPQARQTLETMRDSFARMAPPLPEQAVGPGAKWQVKEPIKSQGMTISQVTTYELVSVNEEVINLKTTIQQNAANQKMENPQMPGMKIDLEKMTGKGGGELTLNLGQMMPSTANMETHSEMAMALAMGGQKQKMAMNVDLSVRMESK